MFKWPCGEVNVRSDSKPFPKFTSFEDNKFDSEEHVLGLFIEVPLTAIFVKSRVSVTMNWQRCKNGHVQFYCAVKKVPKR